MPIAGPWVHFKMKSCHARRASIPLPSREWVAEARGDAPDHIGAESTIPHSGAALIMSCHPVGGPRRLAPRTSPREVRRTPGGHLCGQGRPPLAENETTLLLELGNRLDGGFSSSNSPGAVGCVGGRVRVPRKWAKDGVSPVFHRGSPYTRAEMETVG